MAENPNSTATGEAQFTEGTWLDPVKAQQPDLLKADPPPRFLALRIDLTLSREMVGHFADDDGKALAAQSLPQNPPTLCLSHLPGHGESAAVLKAKPGTQVSDVLGDDQIAADHSILARKTLVSVIGRAERMIGHTSVCNLASALLDDVREVGLRRAKELYDRDQRRRQQLMSDAARLRWRQRGDEPAQEGLDGVR